MDLSPIPQDRVGHSVENSGSGFLIAKSLFRNELPMLAIIAHDAKKEDMLQ